VTLEFLRYDMEIKMGVIIRCKLATHNKSMTKLPNFVSSWESYHKNKKDELFIAFDTV